MQSGLFCWKATRNSVNTESITLSSGARGLKALIDRAVGLDATANVRLRQLEKDTVDVFVTTPFGVTASRRVGGTVSRDGAVVTASAVQDAMEIVVDFSVGPAMTLDLGPARDPAWIGALPPAQGFKVLDTIPVPVVRELADKGQDLARQFSGPLGPPASLLDQTVVTVHANEDTEAAGTSAEITMRLIFACVNLGFIPGFAAPDNVPRHLRVSSLGRWLRVDAPFGTVYQSSSLLAF